MSSIEFLSVQSSQLQENNQENKLERFKNLAFSNHCTEDTIKEITKNYFCFPISDLICNSDNYLFETEFNYNEIRIEDTLIGKVASISQEIASKILFNAAIDIHLLNDSETREKVSRAIYYSQFALYGRVDLGEVDHHTAERKLLDKYSKFVNRIFTLYDGYQLLAKLKCDTSSYTNLDFTQKIYEMAKNLQEKGIVGAGAIAAQFFSLTKNPHTVYKVQDVDNLDTPFISKYSLT